MIELQQALVADHISTLEREGAAIRAERSRDRAERVREHAVAGGQPGARVRLGRWLVAVGESISGTAAPIARTLVDDGPCDDGPDALSHAA